MKYIPWINLTTNGKIIFCIIIFCLGVCLGALITYEIGKSFFETGLKFLHNEGMFNETWTLKDLSYYYFKYKGQGYFG